MHDAWWQQLGGSCQNSREHVISLSACTSGLRNYWNFCHKTCSRSRMRGHITCEHRPIHLLNCPVALHLRTCDMTVLLPLSRVQYCAFPSWNALPSISWGLTLRGDCEACGAVCSCLPVARRVSRIQAIVEYLCALTSHTVTSIRLTSSSRGAVEKNGDTCLFQHGYVAAFRGGTRAGNQTNGQYWRLLTHCERLLSNTHALFQTVMHCCGS